MVAGANASPMAVIDLTPASAHYGLATVLDPEDADAWVGLARVALAQNRRAEARSSLQRASQLAP